MLVKFKLYECELCNYNSLFMFYGLDENTTLASILKEKKDHNSAKERQIDKGCPNKNCKGNLFFTGISETRRFCENEHLDLLEDAENRSRNQYKNEFKMIKFKLQPKEWIGKDWVYSLYEYVLNNFGIDIQQELYVVWTSVFYNFLTQKFLPWKALYSGDFIDGSDLGSGREIENYFPGLFAPKLEVKNKEVQIPLQRDFIKGWMLIMLWSQGDFERLKFYSLNSDVKKIFRKGHFKSTLEMDIDTEFNILSNYEKQFKTRTVLPKRLINNFDKRKGLTVYLSKNLFKYLTQLQDDMTEGKTYIINKTRILVFPLTMEYNRRSEMSYTILCTYQRVLHLCEQDVHDPEVDLFDTVQRVIKEVNHDLKKGKS